MPCIQECTVDNASELGFDLFLSTAISGNAPACQLECNEEIASFDPEQKKCVQKPKFTITKNITVTQADGSFDTIVTGDNLLDLAEVGIPRGDLAFFSDAGIGFGCNIRNEGELNNNPLLVTFRDDRIRENGFQFDPNNFEPYCEVFPTDERYEIITLFNRSFLEVGQETFTYTVYYDTTDSGFALEFLPNVVNPDAVFIAEIDEDGNFSIRATEDVIILGTITFNVNYVQAPFLFE